MIIIRLEFLQLTITLINLYDKEQLTTPRPGTNSNNSSQHSYPAHQEHAATTVPSIRIWHIRNMQQQINLNGWINKCVLYGYPHLFKFKPVAHVLSCFMDFELHQQLASFFKFYHCTSMLLMRNAHVPLQWFLSMWGVVPVYKLKYLNIYIYIPVPLNLPNPCVHLSCGRYRLNHWPPVEEAHKPMTRKIET